MRVPKKNKKSLLEFAGMWPGPKEEVDRIFNEILAERYKSKIREFDW